MAELAKVTDSEPDPYGQMLEREMAARRADWAVEDADTQRKRDRRAQWLREERENQRIEEDDAWKVSPERKSVLRVVYSTIAVVCIGIFVVSLLFQAGPAAFSDKWNLPQRQWWTMAWITSVMLAMLASIVVVAKYSTARHAFLARHRLDKKKADLAEREMSVVRLDLESLWSLTQKRLDLYHEIATGQAEKNYRNSRAAIVLGFMVLILAVVISAMSSTMGGALSAAVAGVAGGALAGYLSRTFLRTSESSTQQLRSYFEQPLAFSKYLSAERLLVNLTAESDRSAAVRELIQQISKPNLVSRV